MYTLAELAQAIGAEVRGDPELTVDGLATLQSASSTQLSFLANPAYAKYLSSTRAGAIILSEEAAERYQGNVLLHANPYLAYARLSHYWDASVPGSDSPIHPNAIVDESAVIAANVRIGPGAVIEAGAVLRDSVIVGPNCVIGRDSELGEGSRLHASVTLYHGVSVGKRCILHSGVVVGSDGFGFAPNAGKWEKIAQIGGVIIGNDVEIGANTAIDRGALDNTVIEDGVKLDNQIQIAHNVTIGENTAMAACCAVAGSTRIGKNCIIGGASGIAGHLEIADNVHITAMTMVIKSLKDAGVYSSGTGVQPNDKWRKSIARLRQLDQMASRLKALEKLVKSRD